MCAAETDALTMFPQTGYIRAFACNLLTWIVICAPELS
jgi:hypothetical protein